MAGSTAQRCARALTGAIAALNAMFALLAMVSTVPPLKFLHRGRGEINVAITHSAGAIIAGYAAQVGVWTDSAACRG